MRPRRMITGWICVVEATRTLAVTIMMSQVVNRSGKLLKFFVLCRDAVRYAAVLHPNA